jgi:CheY-like chemotaxis protein
MDTLILIVDDRQEDVWLTETALEMTGCRFRSESVATGEEALDFLKAAEQLPAVILLDLKMPGMGGLETLRRMRADKRFKDIVVIVVTCSVLESDVQESRDAGANGFIHKAISLNEFSQDLARYVHCNIEK